MSEKRRMGEQRAMELAQGDTYYDYDSGEQYTIATLGHHGDSVLVTTDDGTEMTLDIDMVIEIIAVKDSN